MTDLGEVLQLIHSSRTRFKTVHAVGRAGDSVWRLWWGGDDRFRFERERDGGSFVNVRAGAVWWVIDSDGHAVTNDGDPERGLGMQPELALLHTRSLLAAARLEVIRDEEVAGRPAAIVSARSRPGGSHWRWWGFWDEVEDAQMEIPIDLERGVALGSPYFQINEISFDERLAPELFSRPYPQSHPADHGDRFPREMSLDEARAVAPFPVLVPRLLPEGARLLRCLVDWGKPPEWVGLLWAIDPGATYTLRLRQEPRVAREADRFRDKEITEQGVRFRVEGAASEHAPLRMFAETNGDWYEVDSDLSLETIATIVHSLGSDVR